MLGLKQANLQSIHNDIAVSITTWVTAVGHKSHTKVNNAVLVNMPSQHRATPGEGL